MTEISNSHPGIKIPETQTTEKPKVGHHSFLVEVDGTKTFEQLVKLGSYGWINQEVKEKNFAITNKTKRTATIDVYSFGKCVSYTEVMLEMKRENSRPVTIEELLALGIKYPELQKHSSVVALGSYFEDFHSEFRVPVLSSDSPIRKLNHVARHGDFHPGYAFAAIRKII